MVRRVTTIVIAWLSLTAGPTTVTAQVPGSVSADGMNVVVGRVVVVDGEASHPVPGALVTLIGYLDDEGRVKREIPSGYEATFGRPIRQQAFTRADGYFVFRGLAAGSYTVGAEAAGYLPSDYRPRAVALGDDGTGASVTLRLEKYAAISGRVFDVAGGAARVTRWTEPGVADVDGHGDNRRPRRVQDRRTAAGQLPRRRARAVDVAARRTR
jgi:hypothetical protein